MTVKELKIEVRRAVTLILHSALTCLITIQLQEELSIPTIYQRLFHQGRELEDNSVTLVSVGVVANDVLDLREEAEDVDLIGSDGEEVGQKRKRTDEGRAFGGTLLGSDRPAHTRESSSSSAPHTPVEPLEKSCPACTFVNPPDVLACTICDTVFYTDS